MKNDSTPISLLDLASVQEGKSVADAFHASAKLAQHAEALGFKRFWMAEHHNIAGIASSATSVLLGHVASATSRIRVGSGGIMLPNHAPLVIAEQFGTLETLYPGRIDLGLGRAPGSDRVTMRALRRDLVGQGEDFGEQVSALQGYFADTGGESSVRAIPGAGLDIPIWILGSSLYSAELAARMSLPHAFAGHFAPAQLLQAVALYRREFRASERLAKPHVLVCVQAALADTDERADFIASTLYRRFLGIIRDERALTPPPVASMEPYWSPEEKTIIASTFRFSVIGGPEKARARLQALLDATQADEVMICSELYDLGDRLRSLEIMAEVARA